MPDDPGSDLPDAPRLPQRAAIYIAPDGNVTFGALFAGLVPVAQAIAGTSLPISVSIEEEGRRPRPAPIVPRGSDEDLER
jgi:hypothetical protein